MAESKTKIWLLKRDGNLISAVHPNKYAKRFVRFMRDKVIIDAKDLSSNRILNSNSEVSMSSDSAHSSIRLSQ